MLSCIWCDLTRPLFHLFFGRPGEPPRVRYAGGKEIVRGMDGQDHVIAARPGGESGEAQGADGRKELLIIVWLAVTIGLMVTLHHYWGDGISALPISGKSKLTPYYAILVLSLLSFAVPYVKIIRRDGGTPFSLLRGRGRLQYLALGAVLKHMPLRTFKAWALAMVFFMLVVPGSALILVQDIAMLPYQPRAPLLIVLASEAIVSIPLVLGMLAAIILNLLFWPCLKHNGLSEEAFRDKGEADNSGA
jgi:hypothetical protein